MTRNAVGSAPGSGRLPSLDGLRAIAVSLVCLAHIIGPSRRTGLGNLGVRVFFVLSGFLITTLLLEEWKRNNSINLSRFYFRRVLRIFPAYYAYLAVIGTAAAFGVIDLNRGDLLRGFTYTTDYFMPASSVFIQHGWSLAVEEQFYLLWPALLVLLGRRRGLRLAIAYICLAPIIRILVHDLLADPSKGTIEYRFETVADAIAMGCVLSGYRSQIWGLGWYRRLLTTAWFWCVPAVLLAVTVLQSRAFSAIVGISMQNLLILAIVDRSMRIPTDAFGRVLNSRVLSVTSVLSYSIYLWQQPFLATYQHTWWATFPMNITLTLFATVVSYSVIERPFLALRKAVERQRSVVEVAA